MEDNRPRYSFKCPTCSVECTACLSIFQSDFGVLDMGAGNCPGCKTMLNLTFDPKEKKMIATPFKEWVALQKIEGDK